MATSCTPPRGVRARPTHLNNLSRGASTSPTSSQESDDLTAMPTLCSPSHSISSLSSWRSNSSAIVSMDESTRSPSRLRESAPSSSMSHVDLTSIRSKRTIRTIYNQITPRLGRIRRRLLRRNVGYLVDEVEETTETDIFISAPSSRKESRGWSMHAQSQHPTSSSNSASWAVGRPDTPSTPNAQPCYYSFARNCPGYVIGGTHGDACDACAVRRALSTRNVVSLN